MTPAEQMREAAAVKAHKLAMDALDVADAAAASALCDLAAAIRAIPLAEEALTPREKLRRVREARELLATARVAFVPRGAEAVLDAARGVVIGGWDTRLPWAATAPMRVRGTEMLGSRLAERRTWVLDTLRVEGWNVVEEGEGDG